MILPYKAQPSDRAQTEAGALCTKPECYGLKPDATVIQVAELCHKTLPKHCQEVPVEYTLCYTFNNKKEGAKANAMLDGCGEGLRDTLDFALVAGETIGKWALKKAIILVASPPEALREAINATSLAYNHVTDPDKMEKTVINIFVGGNEKLKKEWKEFFGCLNAKGKSEYACKAAPYLAGGGGVGIVGKKSVSSFLKKMKTKNILKKAKRLKSSGEMLKIDSLNTKALKKTNWNEIDFENIDLTGLNDDIISKMKLKQGDLKALSKEKLAEIDLQKAKSIEAYLSDDQLVALVKANISKKRSIPYLPTDRINRLANQFTIDELPKLNIKVTTKNKVNSLFTNKGQQRVRLTELETKDLNDWAPGTVDFHKLDMSDIDNNLISEMKLRDKIFKHGIPEKQLREIDIEKASSIVEYLPSSNLTILLKENIKRGRTLPEIPRKKLPHLDNFSPEEIPHLTGLGKNYARSLYSYYTDKLKYLGPQQARDVRKYLDDKGYSNVIKPDSKQQVIDKIIVDDMLSQLKPRKGSRPLPTDRLTRLEEVNLHETQDIMQYLTHDEFVTVVKANISRGRTLPELPPGRVAHVFDRFPPEQIPKLTGLEYSWGKLTSTQLRSLNANQARDLRKHIIDNDKKDILKEQLEIVEKIIDNDLKKKGKK